MKFDLTFEFRFGNSWPIIEIDNVISTQETQIDEFNKIIKYSVDCNDRIFFKNSNKKENDTIVIDGKIVRDQIVILSKIHADDILLDLNVLLDQIEYIPEYHQGYINYCQEHNIDIQSKLSTYDLYFNGLWEFKFQNPFWDWYAARRAALNEKFLDKDQIELYIGSTNTEHFILLEKLKNLLCTKK